MSHNYISKWTRAVEKLSQGKHKAISCNAFIARPSALDTLDCPTQQKKKKSQASTLMRNHENTFSAVVCFRISSSAKSVTITVRLPKEEKINYMCDKLKLQDATKTSSPTSKF